MLHWLVLYEMRTAMQHDALSFPASQNRLKGSASVALKHTMAIW